jgi:hypothetical protein
VVVVPPSSPSPEHHTEQDHDEEDDGHPEQQGGGVPGDCGDPALEAAHDPLRVAHLPLLRRAYCGAGV